MKTSAILTSKDASGDAKQKTITYINPEASDANILSMCQAINSTLTKNTYVSTDKVITKNLDTESDAGKQTATMTINPNTITKTALISAGETNATVTYNGDGTIYLHNTNIAAIATYQDSSGKLIIATNQYSSAAITEDVTITLFAPETDNYKAASTTFTVTV